MARKQKDPGFGPGLIRSLKEETVDTVWAIVFFFLTVFLTLAAFNAAGPAGRLARSAFEYLFGVGYFLIPVILVVLGITLLRHERERFALAKTVGSILLLFSGLGIIELSVTDKGGLMGKAVSIPLLRLFDYYASYIFLASIAVISFLIVFETKISLGGLKSILLFWKRKKKDNPRITSGLDIDDNEGEKMVPPKEEDDNDEFADEEQAEEDMDEEEVPVRKPAAKKESDANINISRQQSYIAMTEYTPPPLELLERDRGKPGVGDIKANSNIIKRTLQNFNIDVEMDEISIGPSVTRYALKPAEGVKLSKIVTLQNDLALALAAHPIRIEAPIPGKSLVGIEIPNSAKTIVGLGGLLSMDEYQKSEKPLLVALGKGVSGKSYYSNLAKAPHMLIAGATGSGKSVSIHTIITSLLYRNSPGHMKFIMIDPKRVELTLYNGIPHLLTPVITDAKKTILALKWAAKEMDRRYDVLEAESVRDIESYHKNVLQPELEKHKEGKLEEGAKLPETMPYIVIILDELADIMQTYPRELEAAIVRLAQMSRAVGIHLILSTQRPSVNVITGLIKANVPTRIALQVASQVDSRTILDQAGAEKLLGAGDMLYLSAEMSKPQRIQSAFISEDEVKKVVSHLSKAYKDELPDEINLSPEAMKNSIFESSLDDDGGDGEDDDELYEEARQIVVEAGKASTSYLQRKLRIGYARAARLMDMLEERGVIAAGSGAKPREVIIKDQPAEFGASEEPME